MRLLASATLVRPEARRQKRQRPKIKVSQIRESSSMLHRLNADNLNWTSWPAYEAAGVAFRADDCRLLEARLAHGNLRRIGTRCCQGRRSGDRADLGPGQLTLTTCRRFPALAAHSSRISIGGASKSRFEAGGKLTIKCNIHCRQQRNTKRRRQTSELDTQLDKEASLTKQACPPSVADWSTCCVGILHGGSHSRAVAVQASARV